MKKLFTTMGFVLALTIQAQVINTTAGTGTAGFSGDGGTAISAQINAPFGVWVDASGNTYIADAMNNRIRKVTPSGTITTVAGNGTSGFSGDGGLATSAKLNQPNGVTVDGAGNIYIADYLNNRIRKVTPSGTITTIAGTGVAGFSGDGGLATSAQLNKPIAVALDGAGNLYIADDYNNRIRKVTPTGTITTFAGTGVQGFSGDGGLAVNAQLFYPSGIAIDAIGNVYFVDNSNQRVRKISTTGTITTVAGNGTAGFGGDGGIATSAQFNFPAGIAIDGMGNLYIGDQTNNRVRKVSSTGTITTVAGNGTAGFSGDGGLPSSAKLSSPLGVAVDGAGNLYIADNVNNRIREVACAQPTMNITSTTTLLCTGQSATLTASGASTYTWNPGGNGASIVVSPNVTSNYTITGTNSLTACNGSTVFTQSVSACTGINQLSQSNGISIYPNPNNGSFVLQIENEITNGKILLLNVIGQRVFEQEITKGTNKINVSELNEGIYFYVITEGNQQVKSGKLLIR